MLCWCQISNRTSSGTGMIYVIRAINTLEEHLYYLELVLRKLLEVRLTVNRVKYEFCCKLIPNEDRVQPILDFPVPQTGRRLRRFLRMVGWYSRK